VKGSTQRKKRNLANGYGKRGGERILEARGKRVCSWRNTHALAGSWGKVRDPSQRKDPNIIPTRRKILGSLIWREKSSATLGEGDQGGERYFPGKGEGV